MLLVGLTGGIGTGKTALAALLAERGAQVIDADSYGREALKPGRPAWHSVVDQFGDEILVPGTMEIDRKALARVAFSEPGKLAALNAITHPVIFRAIADAVDRLSSSEAVVVIDAAILVETGMDEQLDALIVVLSDLEPRKKRLRERGLAAADIAARMSAQADPDELAAKADIVVHNDGTLEDLACEADVVWSRLVALQER